MKKINQILVAIDRSAMAAEALKRAISIAKGKDAQLIVMHVIEPSFIESPFIHTIDEDEIKKQLIAQIDQLNSEADLEYILFVESGSAAASITLKAHKTNVDLLVIGTHGKNNVDSNHFGSTTLKLIQNTHIPVLIVKNEVKTIYQKMIAPTNLSEYSKESILFANTLFSKPSRKYIYAFETFSELSSMTFRISKEEGDILAAEMFISAKTALSKFMKEVGDGETALIEYTAWLNEDLLAYIIKNEADLLVLGSKGVGNLNSFLFGSTASYLVQNSPTDVLVYVPVIRKSKSEEKSTTKEEEKSAKQEIKPKISPVQKDLDSRKEEIMEDLEAFFEENLKFTNWNVPEAPDQEIAEGLVAILTEKLNEINQKVKERKYQEKRTDFWG